VLKGLQWPLWLPKAWYNKGCIHRLDNPHKGFASIVMSMGVCVCVSVCEDISGTTRFSTKFFLDVAYDRGSVLLWQGNKIPRGRSNFGVFFPTVNSLYSIAFGTHTKMAEPIEMTFG